MATEVKIPNVGESITSANVAQWHKTNGESVNKGETILTIETDKVSNEIEADVSGTLNILVQEGEEVAIGTVVANITEGAVNAKEAPTETTPKPAAATPAAQASGKEKVVEIKVPAAGESITSANVGHWHVANGAVVAKGNPIVTLDTDKVSNELEADYDGVLNIIVPEGEEVEIGTVIATLTVGAVASAPTPAAQPAATTPAKPAANPSPAAQKTPQPSTPCLLYTSPSPRDLSTSRMPSSA